jgi:integrase
MERTELAWGSHRNVKTIDYPDIEDFLLDQECSEKTRSNIRSCIHDFFVWCCKRERFPIPDMPEIDFELGWREIINMDIQAKILDEIKQIAPFKVWLGVKWLATYVSIRPGELRQLKENHVDIKNGLLIVPNPKEKKPKLIPLLDEDIELIKSLPKTLDKDLLFFRHIKGNGAAKPGQMFGKDLFYKWWKRACANLGIEGVDLYGGTRHSTVTALGEYFSAREIKDSGTFHSSNKAFERYMQGERKGRSSN